jgi:hypothetical protein
MRLGLEQQSGALPPPLEQAMRRGVERPADLAVQREGKQVQQWLQRRRLAALRGQPRRRRGIQFLPGPVHAGTCPGMGVPCANHEQALQRAEVGVLGAPLGAKGCHPGRRGESFTGSQILITTSS